ATSIGIWTKRERRSGRFSKRSTTTGAFTRRSVICRRRSSRPTLRANKRRPLRGAFFMSFLRHLRSIGPMWVFPFREATPLHGLPLVGTAQADRGAIALAPRLIVRDESHRLSLGWLLSSRASLRFTGYVQFAMKVSCRSRMLQRTAHSVLTVCLSQGDHPNPPAKTRYRSPNR